METIDDRPSWQPKAIKSADLEAGLEAAARLQELPVPPALAKQVANYVLRASNELEARKNGSTEALPTQ